MGRGGRSLPLLADFVADTPHLCRLCAEVANNVLAETGDEGHAVRAANAAAAGERWPPNDEHLSAEETAS